MYKICALAWLAFAVYMGLSGETWERVNFASLMSAILVLIAEVAALRVKK